MLTKYQPRFDELQPDQVALIAEALSIDPPPASGAELYAHCDSAGHGQATVIMALARDRSVSACRTMETLIGKPIEVCHPCLSGPDPRQSGNPGQKTPTKSGQRARTAPKSDPRVIVAVVPNPKRPGSASFDRFKVWAVGKTVNECFAEGLGSADLKWDSERGFITLALPDSPEALAVRRES